MPETLTAAELAGWLSLLFRQTVERQIEPKIATAVATVARTLLEARAVGNLEARLAAVEAAAGIGDRGRPNRSA